MSNDCICVLKALIELLLLENLDAFEALRTISSNTDLGEYTIRNQPLIYQLLYCPYQAVKWERGPNSYEYHRISPAY